MHRWILKQDLGQALSGPKMLLQVDLMPEGLGTISTHVVGWLGMHNNHMASRTRLVIELFVADRAPEVVVQLGQESHDVI